MTAKQILSVLTAAGIKPEHIHDVSRDEVTIAVMDPEREGQAKRDTTHRTMKKAAKALGGWGGFSTGWNGWILRASHAADPHAGTKAARMHY